jgi:hypothetical protein
MSVTFVNSSDASLGVNKMTVVIESLHGLRCSASALVAFCLTVLGGDEGAEVGRFNAEKKFRVGLVALAELPGRPLNGAV